MNLHINGHIIGSLDISTDFKTDRQTDPEKKQKTNRQWQKSGCLRWGRRGPARTLRLHSHQLLLPHLPPHHAHLAFHVCQGQQ